LLCVTTLALAEEVRMTAAASTPAAQGVVSTDKDRNNNTEFHVKVEHLAPPEKLDPARQAYVVWIQAPGRAPEPQGQLRVNDELRGDFRGKTVYTGPFDVFITAEDNARALSPSGEEVLRASIEQR
jgi:hypothetical protein